MSTSMTHDGSSKARAPRLDPPVADTPPTKEKRPFAGLTVTRKPPSAEKVPRAVPPNSVPSQANWMLLRPPDGGFPPASTIGVTNVAAPVPGMML